DAVTTNEDTAIAFNPVSGNNEVSGADNFEGAALITKIDGATIPHAGPAVAVSHGSVTLAAGNVLTFTPDADYNGPAVFSYTVSNGGADETANITVTVTAVADIVADAVTTNEDTAIAFNPVSGNNEVSGADNFEGAALITKIDGATITNVGPAVAVSHGSVTLAAGNVLTFTPDADYNGPAVFSYTVSNGGADETANITVTVTAVADIVADAVTTNEDTAIAFNPVSGNNEVSGADNFEGAALITKIDGATITNGGPAVAVSHGSVTLAAGNVLTF